MIIMTHNVCEQFGTNVKAERQFPPEHIGSINEENLYKVTDIKADRSSDLLNGYFLQHFTEQHRHKLKEQKESKLFKCVARMKGKTVSFFLLCVSQISGPFFCCNPDRRGRRINLFTFFV